MELPIEPIPSETNRKIDPRLAKMKYHICKLPATFQILGRCGSGKSSVLWSLLTKAFVYRNKSIFHEIVVYLGSMDSVETFKTLPCKNLVILHEFIASDFEKYLDDLKKTQMDRINLGKAPLNIAVVFDDFVGQAEISPGQSHIDVAEGFLWMHSKPEIDKWCKENRLSKSSILSMVAERLSEIMPEE